MPERPLEGKRVVVTRPREHAGALVDGLERLGAIASVVPLIAIEPLEDGGELRRLVERGGYDWIVFTSVNAVRAAGPAVRRAAAKTAAVGPVTTGALRELGVEPAFVPERFAAREIADGLEPLAGARVLLPQSEIAEQSFADGLRDRGAAVDVVDAYRTVSRAPTAEERTELERARAEAATAGGMTPGIVEGPFKRSARVVLGRAYEEAHAALAGLSELGFWLEAELTEEVVHAIVGLDGTRRMGALARPE